MIGARVGRVVGQAIDWSLLRMFAAVGDMAERTQPPRYRDEADALNALESQIDSWGPDELWSAQQRSAAVSTPAADNTRCAAAASIDGDPFLCCRDTGHAGPHNNPYQKASWIDAGADEVTAAELFAVEQSADNTTDCGCGSGHKCPDPITCPDAVTAAMDEDTAAADGTDLVDAITQLIDYHQAFTPYVVAAEPHRRVACQGCSWRGADHAEHTRHVAALIADMKAATLRIQEQLGGAS